MPPSVAPSQLPKDLAHATKEPSQDDGITRFLDGCCTNGTEMNSNPHDKLLFLHIFLSDVISTAIIRAAGQLSALLAPEADRCRIKPNFHRKFSNWTAMQDDEFWKGHPGDSRRDGFDSLRMRTRQRPLRWLEQEIALKPPSFPAGLPITTWIGPGTLTAANLALAARARVGHIGLAGDVAEWLKAAVC